VFDSQFHAGTEFIVAMYYVALLPMYLIDLPGRFTAVRVCYLYCFILFHFILYHTYCVFVTV
jgi:hypothetical protein